MDRNFRDMLSALSAAGVEFLIVGAHALAAHGRPRATGDLDIWVRPDPANAVRVFAALGSPTTTRIHHHLTLPVAFPTKQLLVRREPPAFSATSELPAQSGCHSNPPAAG